MPLFDPTKAPDEDQIGRLLAYFEKLWLRSHALMGTLSAFYRLQYDVWPALKQDNPEEWRIRPQDKGPRATALIDQAADFNIAVKPTYHREPINKSESQIAAGNRVEKGLQAVAEDAFKRSPLYTPRMASVHLLSYNYAVLNTGLDHSVLEPPPQRREGEPQDVFERREWVWEAGRRTENPILFEAPIPTEVLMDPLVKHPPLALRRKTMKAYEIEGLLGEKVRRRKGVLARIFRQVSDPEEDVEVVEWWSSWWYALMRKGGGGLFLEENRLGIQPYVHTFGVPASSPPGEKYDPVYLVEKSLLFSEMDAIRMMDQARAGNHNIIQRKAWAAFLIDPKSGKTPTKAGKAMEGRIWPFGKEELSIEPTSELAAQAYQEVEDWDREIERTTFSQSAAGLQVSAETATAYLDRADKTGRKFKPYLEQIEDVFSLMGSNILKLVTRISKEYNVKSVGIGEARLSPQDIQGDYRITANFANVDRVVRLQETQQGILEMNNTPNPVRSLESVWRVMGIEDTTTMRREIMDDMIAALPEAAQEALLVGLRERKMHDIANKLQKRAELSRMVKPDGTPLFPGVQGGNGTKEV